MGVLAEKSSLEALAMRHGLEPIGASQASPAFTVVANLGAGRIRITAAAHGFKKYQCFCIIGGAYAGTYRVLNVPDANNVDVEATFAGTTTGNLAKLAYLNGFGFIVRKVPLTIAAITPEDPSTSGVNILAIPFNLGDKYYGPFTNIRVSAGDIDVVRSPIRAALSYTNR